MLHFRLILLKQSVAQIHVHRLAAESHDLGADNQGTLLIGNISQYFVKRKHMEVGRKTNGYGYSR